MRCLANPLGMAWLSWLLATTCCVLRTFADDSTAGFTADGLDSLPTRSDAFWSRKLLQTTGPAGNVVAPSEAAVKIPDVIRKTTRLIGRWGRLSLIISFHCMHDHAACCDL